MGGAHSLGRSPGTEAQLWVSRILSEAYFLKLFGASNHLHVWGRVMESALKGTVYAGLCPGLGHPVQMPLLAPANVPGIENILRKCQGGHFWWLLGYKGQTWRHLAQIAKMALIGSNHNKETENFEESTLKHGNHLGVGLGIGALLTWV